MIYTIGTYKGGPGKTTTAAALAYYLAKNTRMRTLAIDLDAQGNLSLTMAAKGKKGTIADAIRGKSYEPEKVADRLFILPATSELEEIRDTEAIAAAIKAIETAYFNIVIDTPPEVKEQINGALLASDKIIIPVFADLYGAQGFLQIIATVKRIQQRRARLKFGGAFVNMYQRGAIYANMREVIETAAKSEGVPYLGEVRKGVAVPEAAALQTSLFDHAPKSNPAQDFTAIFETILHD